MKVHDAKRSSRRRRREAGTALLIALFALLLIAVVAIALIVASGTETALTGNYHSATAAYYAAVAGLEEGRGRLLTKSPDYFNNTIAGFIPAGGVPANLVSYIRNPIGGEAIDPTDLSAGNAYADREYATEFPTIGGKTVQVIDSVYVSGTSGLPGPLYKWVRITAATEESLGIDINGSGGALNHTRLVYYDTAHVDSSGNITPSLISVTSPPSTAVQVFQVTALAVLPNGSQKMLQYVVAGGSQNLQIPAALTMVGSGVSFSAPFSPAFYVDGNDHDVVGSCNPGATPLTGLGYTTPGDLSGTNRPPMVSAHPTNYLGLNPQPSVNEVEAVIAPNLINVAGLNKVVHDLGQIADATSGTTSISDAAPGPFAGMSPSTPKIIVVNGDLTVSGWNNTGYGLLVVTGNLNFDSTASWRGLILLIGQGKFTGASGGTGDIRGGILLAKILDSAGNPLAAPAASSYIETGNGTGVYYSSCWIKAVQPAAGYSVLSFRELSQ